MFCAVPIFTFSILVVMIFLFGERPKNLQSLCSGTRLRTGAEPFVRAQTREGSQTLLQIEQHLLLKIK